MSGADDPGPLPHRGAPGGVATPPEEPAGTWLTLLGGFQLTVGGAVVELPVTSQRLVALLALEGRCGRSRLAGTLWPDSSEERALACLRTGIWRLNHAAAHVVVTSGGQVGLGPQVGVDVQRYLEAVGVVMAAPGARSGWAGLVGVDGDLLPEWSDDWLIPHRERLRQMRLHFLEAAAHRLCDMGSYGLALDAALASLRADPLRESAHRAVIHVHVAEGNLVEARRAYAACRLILGRELGVEPSPQTAHALQPSAASDVRPSRRHPVRVPATSAPAWPR